jgi:hypothetical protein
VPRELITGTHTLLDIPNKNYLCCISRKDVVNFVLYHYIYIFDFLLDSSSRGSRQRIYFAWINENIRRGKLFKKQVIEQICEHAFRKEREKLKLIEQRCKAQGVQIVTFECCKICGSIVNTGKDWCIVCV